MAKENIKKGTLNKKTELRMSSSMLTTSIKKPKRIIWCVDLFTYFFHLFLTFYWSPSRHMFHEYLFNENRTYIFIQFNNHHIIITDTR